MWFTRQINERLQSVTGREFSTISDLEKFGEKSKACAIHSHLEVLGVRDLNADNGARLIGQAWMIADLIKAIPSISTSSKRSEIPLELINKYNIDINLISQKAQPKELENAVYDMASIGFIRLCGVTEIYIPNSPKHAFPAFLYAVSPHIHTILSL
ncbi:NADH dehydrogenase (ubiquinone) complex I, assembly factor 6 [Smittium mucronatum]|uniref:NADH dehydrogenase (Ubiquinone) complex I, assembly factor 6 n=1 Tax=Smittium mucronatum TaxID=133383 RepID=A0A1R0H0V0_9FUNG|nr:NADH dehydrogenase (ubiquinone) complex I, assembly factor 6 [Smittium mucronatum]